VRPYYSAVRFLANALFGVWSGWDVTGAARVPRAGGLIVACNHISFWDPPLIGTASPRELHYLAKQELFRGPLGVVIRSLNAIPIRRGAADLAGLSRAIEALRGGDALLMFPEGTRIRGGELHAPRPGVGMLAVHADAAILPAYISGSNRPGRWLWRGARVRISFGTARSWREFAGEGDVTPGRALYQRIGEGVMREIAALKRDQSPPASRGAA
jgi:1-acyl-sn-glycerol-3-phosphate acyltransferase